MPTTTAVMRTLGLVVITVVVVGAVAWLALMIAYPDYVYRYRLTVELEDDGKILTGSNVIEVHNQKQPRFGAVPPVLPRAIGDAIYFDLGSKGHLIATLAFGPKGTIPDGLEVLVPKVFGLALQDRDLKRLLHGRRELAGEDIPTLVTFSDLNDPMTARIVRPEELPQVFGEEVRFIRAYVEMTTDPVSRAIEAKLRWLPHPQYLNGHACDPTKPHCLHGGDFMR